MAQIKDKKTIDHPVYVTEVGRLCAAWSYFEMITDRLLWGILDVNPVVGSIISSQKEMAGRWSLIVNHASGRLTPPECKFCRLINKELAAVATDRNIVVHGRIFVEQVTNNVYASITRGANAGKWYPLTKEAVDLIIHNIAYLAEAAKLIAGKYKWLEEEPDGPRVSDWPKRIERLA